MAMRRNWCDICRGDDDLFPCTTCPRKFHSECAKVARVPEPGSGWQCQACNDEADADEFDGRHPHYGMSEQERRKATKQKKETAARVRKVNGAHQLLKSRRGPFLMQQRAKLLPFVTEKQLDRYLAQLPSPAAAHRPGATLRIGPKESYIHAELREYQVGGVNWILQQYGQGVGGILADEMGLGKTVQTLSFLATLKHKGDTPGPHLVITPLAVLQNWVNELKRFTPSLTFCKVQGNMAERDRVLSDPEVLAGEFDVYLTTYETVMNEEAFFTDNFLWHTICIDEGHRIKNENSKLCGALGRIRSPFRLLLTGTPLQNSMHELYALLCYILPEVITDASVFDRGFAVGQEVDRGVLQQARTLLEALMLRRIKADVETNLKAKGAPSPPSPDACLVTATCYGCGVLIEYKVYVPLVPLQRRWYQRMLTREAGTEELLTMNQLMSKLTQLMRVCNHPKQLLFSLDRRRIEAASKLRRAEGSEYAQQKVEAEMSTNQTEHAAAMETELRSLTGEALLLGSGKLALLDRMLLRLQREGSRVLLFSQWTQTLDVLEEYVRHRFGLPSEVYLRLDGSTNRISRELDVRTFNAAGSRIFLYLISTKAGGQGINLATADTVVLYDSCWNPQVDLQAQDRAHRIGQKKQVRIFRFVSEGTAEERVVNRAEQKMFLDAMVVKKQSAEVKAQLDQSLKGAATLKMQDVDINDEGAAIGDMEEDTNLSVKELLSILSHGAENIFRTATDSGALTSAALDQRLESIMGRERRPSGQSAGRGRSRSSRGGKQAKTAGSASAEPSGLNAEPASEDEDVCTAKLQVEGHSTIFDNADSMIAMHETQEGPAGQEEGEPSTAPAAGGGTTHVVCSTSTGFGEQQHETEDMELAPLPPLITDGAAARAARPGVRLYRCGKCGLPKVLECQCKRGGGPKGKVEEDAVVTGSRSRAPPKRFEPPSLAKLVQKKAKVKHDGSCFNCLDGGDVIACGVCPRVYHLKCAGLEVAPKGTFRCPWHMCTVCERNKSNVGGMLFQCVTCPLAYCFDCCPEDFLQRSEPFNDYKQVLERRGYNTQTSLFFTCTECKETPVKAAGIVRPPEFKLKRKAGGEGQPTNEVGEEEEEEEGAEEEQEEDRVEEEEEEEEEEESEEEMLVLSWTSKRKGKRKKRGRLSTWPYATSSTTPTLDRWIFKCRQQGDN
ncbi:hypothetical protein CYMTET_6147 [Cymbomonas tetramitiformis]|uniref:Uncharacterized protein n=1 Tax=Cymbomonas tetramitiformis TaxID=36881 RepID=A0AAE0LI75_9CHLO|nr:hypothetical protein CYMTET_6147 [Cymbomonas tetramitiformis]